MLCGILRYGTLACTAGMGKETLVFVSLWCRSLVMVGDPICWVESTEHAGSCGLQPQSPALWELGLTFAMCFHSGNTANSLSSTHESSSHGTEPTKLCPLWGQALMLDSHLINDLCCCLRLRMPPLLSNTSSHSCWNPPAPSWVTSCCTPGGRGRCGRYITAKGRAGGKHRFNPAPLTSFLSFTVGPRYNYHTLQIHDFSSLLGNTVLFSLCGCP